jgi:hypothetical protein
MWPQLPLEPSPFRQKIEKNEIFGESTWKNVNELLIFIWFIWLARLTDQARIVNRQAPDGRVVPHFLERLLKRYGVLDKKHDEVLPLCDPSLFDWQDGCLWDWWNHGHTGFSQESHVYTPVHFVRLRFLKTQHDLEKTAFQTLLERTIDKVLTFCDPSMFDWQDMMGKTVVQWCRGTQKLDRSRPGRVMVIILFFVSHSGTCWTVEIWTSVSAKGISLRQTKLYDKQKLPARKYRRKERRSAHACGGWRRHCWRL